MDHHCFYLCIVFEVLSCLFIVALWSSAGKGLTSWLALMFSCVFVAFKYGVLSRVWLYRLYRLRTFLSGT